MIGFTACKKWKIDGLYYIPSMKKCSCRFLKNKKVANLKPGTHMESGLIYRVY